MDEEPFTGSRRYLKTREKPWAQSLAKTVCKLGVTPDFISVLSVIFSIIGGACLMTASFACCRISSSLLWFGAALCIQLRLICNLLDGMVAIEGGKKTAVGALYNEVPDRIADAFFFIAAGYCNDWVLKFLDIPLGWVVAILSILTAYIRVLGGTLIGTQSFMGPMAKQHRMALLTLACLGSIAELWIRQDGKAEEVMRYTLTVIVVGALFTCWRRLALISQQLNEKHIPVK